MIQVIIPTYNRASCIRNLIERSIMPYEGVLFSFLILDSSTNADTEKMCTKAGEKCNFEYHRVEPTVQPDDKVIGAIEKCKAEYYWVFGDGNLADFNRLECKFLEINYSCYDIMEIDFIDSKRNPSFENECFIKPTNLLTYVASHFTYLTYWGSSIIRTNRAHVFFQSGKMNKYRQDVLSWWSPCLVCEIIGADMDIGSSTSICSIYTNCLGLNDEKKERSWANGEQYYITTFRVFNRDVALLPSRFNSIKQDIIKTFRSDLLVSKRYLLHLKYNGVLNLQYVRKYKKDIQAVKGDYLFMLALSVVPCAMLNVINRILKNGKRLIK